ncbi:MAG: rRNA maturation RNase YbeY [Pseudolabrys sp.]|nr:rRNA maturation RNase YbeY [Pseudolabrys sp.]
MSTPVVDIRIASPLWNREPRSASTVRKAIVAAAHLAAVSAPGDISVLLSDDEELRALNRRWRGIDKPTNVLSFPAADGPVPRGGDIAIAFETLQRESQMEGKPFQHHLAHLAVHGFLHLLGYDHHTDSDAEVMESLERDSLARLAIADPYRTNATGNA